MEDCFIGGHPMAGSEKTGLKNANEYLLENAYYILTPTTKTSPERLEEFRSLVTQLGAVALVLDYHLHDYATAAISHLPHHRIQSRQPCQKIRRRRRDDEDDRCRGI